VDLTTLPAKEIARQLSVSRDEIESRLGKECLHFSYTWGRHDRNVRQCVLNAGYRYAAAAIHGALVKTSDRLAFPRVDVRREYALADFASLVSGKWDFLTYWQHLRRLIG